MRLLVIAELNNQISDAVRIANDNGASVLHTVQADLALNDLRSGKGVDLVMIDVKNDVAAFINSLKSERITVPVIGCGMESDSKAAVAAIKAGAKEYVTLPPDEAFISAILKNAAVNSQEFIADAPAMQHVKNIAKQVAPSDASILITGESGTGKEVMAQFIHQNSTRSKKSIVSVNCAAIPDNLLESELFGHEKGSFTGAVSRRIGKFEEANGSTLLLDEISEMDLRLQAKLLRVIQEKEIDRVGGNKPVKVNIRIIATSNRDLQKEIKLGKFREDLFYRLNVINLELPPLRERKSDIKNFAKHFANKYCTANGFSSKILTSNTLTKLENYNWPGNVRELENTLHRAVLMSPGESLEDSSIILTCKAANENSRQTAGVESNASEENSFVGKTVSEMEKVLILKTLDHCFGNRTHAANILGISIRTLRNKLNEYKQAVV